MSNLTPQQIISLKEVDSRHEDCTFFAYLGTADEACQRYRMIFESEPEAVYEMNHTCHIPITGDKAISILKHGRRKRV